MHHIAIKVSLCDLEGSDLVLQFRHLVQQVQPFSLRVTKLGLCIQNALLNRDQFRFQLVINDR